VLTLRLLSADRNAGHHEGEISCCAYTPNNRAVLTGGWDGWLRAWDADSGAALASLQAATRPVTACAVSPDGKEWLAGTLEGVLARWDADSKKPLSKFVAHPRPISAIHFTAAGPGLATAAWDGKVVVRDRADGQERKTLTGHSDIVAGCRFAPDGRSLVSWSHDGSLRLWDVKRGKTQKTLGGHADRVVAGAVSPDGNWAASGSRDGVLKLWELQSGAQRGTTGMGGEIRACFFLLDGETLAVVEATGRLRLYGLPNLTLVTELATGLAVQCAELSPSGGQIALGCHDGTVQRAGIEGFDHTPLAVTVTQAGRRTATVLQRFFGRSRWIAVNQFVCPACRHPFELPAQEPRVPTPCPNCRRSLRVGGVIPLEEAAAV
jgi:WD40 repeat protein